jgi:hypothetical protein
MIVSRLGQVAGQNGGLNRSIVGRNKLYVSRSHIITHKVPGPRFSFSELAGPTLHGTGLEPSSAPYPLTSKIYGIHTCIKGLRWIIFSPAALAGYLFGSRS